MGQFRALKSLVAKVFERKTRRGRRPALRVGFRPTLAVLEAREVPALTFQFDYSYDTNGFFSSQDRKDALERAGTDLAKYVTTTLGAITPAGSDTWNAYFANPADGTLASVANPSIASGVVRVYAGGRDFTGGTLAATTLGDRDASGSQAWVTQVATRGQGSDYSTWGGSVSFDTTGLTWYTGTGQVSGGQYDLYSVALHELGHTLGFANSPLSPQFQSFVSGASFTGPQAVFANAGTPALDTSGGSHWADTTTWNAAKASMDPTFTTGERRPFSGLDYAALADIGWDLNLVVGTRWNDTITLTPGSGNTVQVNITSVSPPPPPGVVGPPAQFSRSYTIDASNGVWVDAEAGNDLVIINDSITAGAITVNGGAGTDVVQLNGTSGNDLFYANGNQINRVGDSVVTLAADTESSVIYAGNGDDAVSVVAGLSKPLEFNGGNGSDAVAFYGTSGVDFMLFGNVGPQTGARNGDAQVYWNGQTESAVASGGDGDDVLNAYAGLGTPVTFAGGNGTDTAVYYGTNGSDLFYVSANLISLVGFQSITLGSDAELTVANGGDGNDAVSVDAGLSKPHTFVGGNGTDTVSLYGTSAGEIFLLGYWGARTGGRHGDAAYASWEPTTEAVQVSGDGGNDVLNVYAGLLTPTTFYGGGGTDTVVFYGTSNDDTYFGNNNTAARIGDALVTFDGNVEDVKFYGGAGNDTANIAVSTIVSYLFAGEAGTADVLNVTVSGYVRTNTGTGSGYYTYPNTPSYKIINFTGIES